MKVKPTVRADWFRAIQRLLTGNKISYVAPSNRGSNTRAAIAAKDAATVKRARKQVKRSKAAG